MLFFNLKPISGVWWFCHCANLDVGLLTTSPSILQDSTAWIDFGNWQIGNSQKSFFGTSYSPELGIMTDTLPPYPTNAYDYFTFYYEVYANGFGTSNIQAVFEKLALRITI